MKTLISIISAIFIAIGITACGYDGHYRYPCQDPANWEAPECNPPLCEAAGTCTVDLLGYDPKEGKEEAVENVTDELPEETTSDIMDNTAKTDQPSENVDNINSMVDDISKGN